MNKKHRRDVVRHQHDSAGRPVNPQVESSGVGVVTAARWRLRRRGGSDSRLDINKAICLVCEKIPRALITNSDSDSKSSWFQVMCEDIHTLLYATVYVTPNLTLALDDILLYFMTGDTTSAQDSVAVNKSGNHISPPLL